MTNQHLSTTRASTSAQPESRLLPISAPGHRRLLLEPSWHVNASIDDACTRRLDLPRPSDRCPLQVEPYTSLCRYDRNRSPAVADQLCLDRHRSRSRHHLHMLRTNQGALEWSHHAKGLMHTATPTAPTAKRPVSSRSCRSPSPDGIVDSIAMIPSNAPSGLTEPRRTGDFKTGTTRKTILFAQAGQTQAFEGEQRTSGRDQRSAPHEHHGEGPSARSRRQAEQSGEGRPSTKPTLRWAIRAECSTAPPSSRR